MDFQLAPSESFLYRLSDLFGLFPRPTVHENIVGVSLERQPWKRLLHPGVEREMEEDIREQRADDGPNAKDNSGRDRASESECSAGSRSARG